MKRTPNLHELAPQSKTIEGRTAKMGHDVVSLVPYDERYRGDFDRLNRAWVSRYFVVEPSDEEELGDPHGHFVATGGQVLFLVTGSDEVIGTVALARHGSHEFELAKMTVDERYRGRGYADLLMQGAIAFARDAGATALFLVSNTSLAAALTLYEKYGFVAIPLEPDEEYTRANIRMRRTI